MHFVLVPPPLACIPCRRGDSRPGRLPGLAVHQEVAGRSPRLRLLLHLGFHRRPLRLPGSLLQPGQGHRTGPRRSPRRLSGPHRPPRPGHIPPIHAHRAIPRPWPRFRVHTRIRLRMLRAPVPGSQQELPLRPHPLVSLLAVPSEDAGLELQYPLGPNPAVAGLDSDALQLDPLPQSPLRPYPVVPGLGLSAPPRSEAQQPHRHRPQPAGVAAVPVAVLQPPRRPGRLGAPQAEPAQLPGPQHEPAGGPYPRLRVLLPPGVPPAAAQLVRGPGGPREGGEHTGGGLELQPAVRPGIADAGGGGEPVPE